jgi:DNA-binding transcriptional ArsR family regulator
VIRIEIDDATLARTRIAISPLWELACSLRLIDRNREEAPWPYTGWARHARSVIAGFPPDSPLWSFFGRSWTPDFLTPIPVDPAATIEEELARLRTTPASVVESQLTRAEYGPDLDRWRPFAEDPQRSFGALADDLWTYWQAAIAPWWRAMRTALDEEVLHRAKALATDGPDALLADLHDRVLWNRPVLTLVKPMDQTFVAVDQRLLLIPLIFSRGALSCSTDDPQVVAVSYQARGAALLSDERDRAARESTSDTDRLTILVGRGRASVLRALVRPATTSALARDLGLAPSTVSEHLSALSAAGVVRSHRAGRRVLYALEPAGHALVTLLGEVAGPARASRTG